VSDRPRPDQFDLFQTAPVEPKPYASIGGLTVHLDKHCRCGSTIAVIVEGKGPHAAALQCPRCETFRHGCHARFANFSASWSPAPDDQRSRSRSMSKCVHQPTTENENGYAKV
jgi:hypothetical protein